MGLLPLTRRKPEHSLRLPRRELASLRRWLQASAAARLAPATPSPIPLRDRRDTGRHPLETSAELRPISAGGIGLIRSAIVRDVSADGIALVVDQPLNARQQVSLDIQPPAGLPRRPFRRGDRPVQILAVVRYCRPEGDKWIVGCSFGIEWADSLANEMFPADLAARRTA